VNLTYNVVPELILSTSGGQRTVEAPPLAGTLTYAKDDQFSCYSLQGNTFVKVDPAATGAPPTDCV
jgi:hypothetical protein